MPVNGAFKTPPTKTVGTSSNCDFHIFSWQWFTYLMNPVASPGTGRNFENYSIFPTVDLDTCPSVTAGSALFQAVHKGLTPAVLKVMDMPDIPGQAGLGNAFYDRNKNIVFYNRTFTANECGVYGNSNFPDPGGASTTTPPFPTGFNQVLEIKTSWRIMGANDDATRYYVVSANIEGIGTKTLGLVGMHNIVNTQGTSRVRLGHIRTPR